MSSLLFVEAFGQLIPDTSLIDSEEEYLYSVFRARAELMGWSSTSDRRSLLWEMNEAELTVNEHSSRIGFVQVGLNVGDIERTEVPPERVPGWVGYSTLGVRQRAIEPVAVLPPLIQCFDDALRRIGDIELSGLQVTANSLDDRAQSLVDLVGMLNWFNTTPKGRADALIAFDDELLGGHTVAELVANLHKRNTGQRNTGSFEFGPVVAVPEEHSIKVGVETPIRSITPARSGLGLSVTLPEWTASAAAWALAIVIDTARASSPNTSKFAVRVARV